MGVLRDSFCATSLFTEHPVGRDADCIARVCLWMSDVTGGVEVDLATAVIEHRLGSGEADVRSAGQVSDTALLEAVPWRTFRFYQGQRHYSGKFWAATERGHVIYESRLELSSLLLEDFDPAVSALWRSRFG